jgi:hypothetical protein
LKQVIVPSACTRFLGFIKEVLVDQGGLGFGDAGGNQRGLVFPRLRWGVEGVSDEAS